MAQRTPWGETTASALRVCRVFIIGCSFLPSPLVRLAGFVVKPRARWVMGILIWRCDRTPVVELFANSITGYRDRAALCLGGRDEDGEVPHAMERFELRPCRRAGVHDSRTIIEELFKHDIFRTRSIRHNLDLLSPPDIISPRSPNGSAPHG
jgi:hypothetical protein